MDRSHRFALNVPAGIPGIFSRRVQGLRQPVKLAKFSSAGETLDSFMRVPVFEPRYLSLSYAQTMARLVNRPMTQPALPVERQLASARKMHADAAAVVARGVTGKYQAQRQAQVTAYSHAVSVLCCLLGIEPG